LGVNIDLFLSRDKLLGDYKSLHYRFIRGLINLIDYTKKLTLLANADLERLNSLKIL
jgi:hypothetical protein